MNLKLKRTDKKCRREEGRPKEIADDGAKWQPYSDTEGHFA